MKFGLAYHKGTLSIEIPDQCSVDMIKPIDILPLENPEKEAARVIQSSFAPNFLSRITLPYHHRVSIAITDKTRPVPLTLLLPPLLKELKAAGIPNENISLIAATGTHTPMLKDEILKLLPEDLEPGYEIISHDCDDNDNHVYLGITQKGINVFINSAFINADTKIVIGNIEPHHFMGFSGGAKCAAIGLAGRETIRKNHEMLKHPLSTTGEFENNPMRQDIEEIGKMIGIDLAINAVINTKKEIAAIFAGPVEKVIQEGIQFVNRYCQVSINKKYDLVIASSGGFPKDINLYQAQKGLTNAAAITKDGGTVFLAAACSEGIGSPGLDAFMNDVHSPREVFEKFEKEGFSIGPHKAFLIARQLNRVKVYLYSFMDQAETERMLFEYADDLQKTIDDSIGKIDHKANIALMPNAVITVPDYS